MKKVIFVFSMLMGIGTISFAQTADHAAATSTSAQTTKMSTTDRAQKMTDQMQKTLTLTDKQHADIYKINLDAANKMDAARTSGDKTAFMQIRQTRDEQISKVLTPEQQQKFKAAQPQSMQPHTATAPTPAN